MPEFHPAQGDTTPYTCAECGEPILVVDGKIYKPCGHLTAAVLASLTATVYGEGKAQ